MRITSTTFHWVRDIHLEKVSRDGTSWTTFTIPNRNGSSHVVNCFSGDEPHSITFGPDNIPIDDKLASE